MGVTDTEKSFVHPGGPLWCVVQHWQKLPVDIVPQQWYNIDNERGNNREPDGTA